MKYLKKLLFLKNDLILFFFNNLEKIKNGNRI